MSIRSRLTALSAPWRVAAVVLTVLVNIAVLWLAVDSTLFTPSTEPSGPGGLAETDKESAPEELVPDDGLPVDVLVTVTPTPSGMLDVIEEVRPPGAIGTLVLRTPPSLGTNNGPALALGLAVLVDDNRVIPTRVSDGSWRVALPGAVSRIVLSYRLSGFIQQSRDAPEGRALLQVRPLTATSEATATAVIEIVGVPVRNLVCPDRPLADQLCGRADGDQWRTAPVPTDQSTVVALIDLPAADPLADGSVTVSPSALHRE